MHFIDTITKATADAIKSKIRAAFHQSHLTLQQLESFTAVDYCHHQRSLDLTSDQYPSIVLPALLAGHGDDANQFAATIIEIAGEPLKALFTPDLNGSLLDELINMNVHLGAVASGIRARHKVMETAAIRSELMGLIEQANHALLEIGLIESGRVR